MNAFLYVLNDKIGAGIETAICGLEGPRDAWDVVVASQGPPANYNHRDNTTALMILINICGATGKPPLNPRATLRANIMYCFFYDFKMYALSGAHFCVVSIARTQRTDLRVIS